MWTARVPDQWNQAVKDQKLRQVGLSYAESEFEGWYVPDYVAAAHPELGQPAELRKADRSHHGREAIFDLGRGHLVGEGVHPSDEDLALLQQAVTVVGECPLSSQLRITSALSRLRTL